MKKIYLYILIFISPYLSYAQVGINTDNPDLSAMLQVVSASKGVSIPNVHLQSLRDNMTIPNPKESLLVFNTNENLVPGKGLYYWRGDRWIVIFSEKSQFLFENLVKFYAGRDNIGYNFRYNRSSTSSDDFYGENTNNSSVGTSLNSEWTVIDGLTSNIEIDRIPNDELYTVSGMMQANNDSESGYVSSSIGIFIDDKLVAIKPLIMRFGSRCAYREFTVSFFTKDLTIGQHQVKFAIRNRGVQNNANLILSYGKRNQNSNCNTLTDDETRISSSIYINQPFDF